MSLASVPTSQKIKNEEWTRLAYHPLIHRSSGIAIHFLGIQPQSAASVYTVKEVIHSLKPSVVLLRKLQQSGEIMPPPQTCPWMPLDTISEFNVNDLAMMQVMESAQQTGSIIKYLSNDSNSSTIKSAKLHFKLVEPTSTKSSWIGNLIYKTILLKKFGKGFQSRLVLDECTRLELADFLRTWALFHPTNHYKLLEAPCASIMYQTRSILQKMVLGQSCSTPDSEPKSLLIVVDKAYTFGLFDLWTRYLQDEVFRGSRLTQDYRLESDLTPKQEEDEPVRHAQCSS